MKLYTYQIPHWRRLQGCGVPLVDTTVKSGDPRMAPTWAMVMSVKSGTLSEEEYTRAYNEMLDYMWFADPAFWDDLLRQPRIALGCYCPAHTFCHRYLLTDFLVRHTHATYHGELTPQNVSRLD